SDEFEQPPYVPSNEHLKFQEALKELRKALRTHHPQTEIIYAAFASAAEKMERYAAQFRDDKTRVSHLGDARDMEAVRYLAAFRTVSNLTFKDRTWESLAGDLVKDIHNHLTTYYQDVLDQGKALADVIAGPQRGRNGGRGGGGLSR